MCAPTRYALHAAALAAALRASTAVAQTAPTPDTGLSPGAQRVTIESPDAASGDGVVVGIGQTPPRRGQFVLWGAPLPTFFYAANGAFSIALGAELPLTPSLSIVLESGLTIGRRAVFGFGTGSSESSVTIDTAVGLSWLFINVSGTGPIVLPKLGAQFAQLNESLGVSGVNQALWTALVGPGIDLGFQFSAEHVRITLLVGVSVGYCYCATLATQPGTFGSSYEIRRTERWEPGFDLNLFRAGLSF